MAIGFEQHNSPKAAVELCKEANLTGRRTHRANALLAINWLGDWGRAEAIGEEEDLFGAPSSA